MPYITLDTYPPMVREDYDDVFLLFTVPYEWLCKKFSEDAFGTDDFDSFLRYEYTWDDTQWIYDRAVNDKVIVSERIIRR